MGRVSTWHIVELFALLGQYFYHCPVRMPLTSSRSFVGKRMTAQRYTLRLTTASGHILHQSLMNISYVSVESAHLKITTARPPFLP